MDKKNQIIGVLLLVAAFAFMLYPRKAPPPPPPAQPRPAAAGADQPVAPVAPAVPPAPSAPAAQQSQPAEAPAPAPAPPAITDAPDQPQLLQDDTPAGSENPGDEILQNDFIEVRFTKKSGAIETVGFKKYPAAKNSAEPYRFNDDAGRPLLAFGDSAYDGVKIDSSVNYRRIEKTGEKIVYAAEYAGHVKITRTYTIVPAGAAGNQRDPYLIRHEITVENLKERQIAPHVFWLNVGTATPARGGSSFGPSLSGGYYDADGKDSHFIDVGGFSSGGFLGLGSRETRESRHFNGLFKWASVSNQFFTGILVAGQPGRMVWFSHNPNATQGPGTGMAAHMAFDMPALPAKGSAATLAFDYYVGPKEYTRLSSRDSFPNSEADVMQYANGWYRKIMLSGAISPFMNWLMTLMHKVVSHWGLAIILMTLLLKTVTLPFTLAASRSAKRMQKLTPELRVLREKHKDNPQKLNQATMELWKKHKINPLGGCLPVLITMPLFVAFFFMLQSAAELRFQGFLWAGDLSSPDTVTRLPWVDIPLNIMPLLMGATMMIQMRLTPSPGVDNAQMKMMKFMPIFFTFICYNFSCALALYSTINGIFTICQQLIVNRMKDKEPAPAATAAAFPPGGAGTARRPIKNAPQGKKKF